MKYPVTQAVRFLRDKGIEFVPHLFDYVEKGGTRHSAASLGVNEHEVVKTLIFETSEGRPVAVLMHGDLSVSEKNLARHLDVKSATPAAADKAQRWTGYVFGGTSPFGMRTAIPILAERSIFRCRRIFINGGKRGFLVEIDPDDIKAALDIDEADIGI